MLFNPAQPQSEEQQLQFSNKGTVAEFALTTTPRIVATDRDIERNRKSLMLFNAGTANALFAYGTSISVTNFTAELLPGGYYLDSPVSPWQGPVVAQAKDNPTKVNITELVLI